MARKPASDPLVPVTLVTGAEELLVDRAVAAIVAAVRAVDPDPDIRDMPATALVPVMLDELTSPSLFSTRTVIVLRAIHDLGADVSNALKSYLTRPAEDVVLILTHAGSAKGKALLDAARKAGAREIACAKLTKPAERIAFVKAEFRGAGRTLTEDASRALLDAVGTDLREIAAACGQLVADTVGTVDETVVARYYSGRAEVSGFVVADRAVEGRTAEALEQLRWALSVGVAPVLVTSALAQGVRGVARLATAPRNVTSADLARELGMPPWKLDRVRQQARGWSEDGVTVALRAVAEADAAVKGGGDDPGYALEKAVVAITRARSLR